MIQSFKSMVPVVDETAYVHPMATIIGHVTIGKNCYIGPGAVLRGDWGIIEVSNGCNIQENCVVHLFPGTTVRLEEGAHVRHGVIVHGAKLGRQCMIGMNAVIMDDVEVGEGCIVGALSFLKAQSQWKDRTIIAGNPAKILGEVSDDMLAHKVEGTGLYQGLPADFHSSLRECEPLRAEPLDRPSEFPDFETWQQRRKRK